MNKKQKIEVIKALMYGAGLDPDFECDLYEDYCVDGLLRLCRGFRLYLNISQENNPYIYSQQFLPHIEAPSGAIKTFLSAWEGKE